MDYETPPAFQEPPSDEPRRGRARERQRRRSEQRAAMVRPAGSRTARSQLVPSGALKIPELRIPESRYLIYGAGALLLVLGILAVLGQFKSASAPPETPPNGLWLGTEWTYALDEQAEVEDLVQRLREHRIGTVYAWVSWLKDDLSWGGRRDGTNEFSEVEPVVENFVQEFKELYPESILYGWVSVPVGSAPHDMGDADVQQAVADFSQRVMTEFGFDGVFLNIEPVWNNDTTFLTLLSKVREAIGDTALISTAIPPDWSPLGVDIPVPPLIVPGTVWDERYKQSVALIVDELAVMAYNSGLSRAPDYSEWVAYQTATYAGALSALDTGAGAGAHVMIGIPTYEAELPAHDPLVENIPSAIDGVKLGLQQAGNDARYVRGVAIYADWETDETEWSQLMMNWVNQP